MAELPRPEHPRPQFERAEWLNLNGVWTFALDHGKSGEARGWAASQGFGSEIIVPFCPESRLSGVGHTDFIEQMWYHRKVEVPTAWRGKRVLLHFGGVDYECELFVDGKSAGRHYGGSASFRHDLTDFVRPGNTHHLVLLVRDRLRAGVQPSGKQCMHYNSGGCSYTRTTGIWQTVWLEAVAPAGLDSCHIVPDLDGGRFLLQPRYLDAARGLRFRAVLKDGGATVAETVVPAAAGVGAELRVKNPKPWGPGHPFLYDLELTVENAAGERLDAVRSYAGLRKIHIEGNRVFLNNEPLYQRLVLDQGFYPDGIWTAPSDAALRRDIELAQAAGFNGARLHQKVFEERFHYWADRLGYLTWGESASWGLGLWLHESVIGADPGRSAWNFLAEWREIVTRDRNHPSIVAWSPFNETSRAVDWTLHCRIMRDAYRLTRDLDPQRPVNDSSGYVHVETDLYTVHNYEQQPEALKAQLQPDPEKGVWRNFPELDAAYAGQPYIVDEFGGIKWIAPGHQWGERSWGYGEGPKTLDEFYARLEGQVHALLSLKHIDGYCYTQLTDVEQEQNGIYNYDRTEKFDMRKIRAIFAKENC